MAHKKCRVNDLKDIKLSHYMYKNVIWNKYAIKWLQIFTYMSDKEHKQKYNSYLKF